MGWHQRGNELPASFVGRGGGGDQGCGCQADNTVPLGTVPYTAWYCKQKVDPVSTVLGSGRASTAHFRDRGCVGKKLRRECEGEEVGQ